MRKRRLVEISSIEEAEVEPLEEGDGETVEKLPPPPIWHKRCSRCGQVFNVLKVKCPNCRRR